MKRFIEKYKGFFHGFWAALIVFFFLREINFIRVANGFALESLLPFSFLWMFCSFIVHRLPYFTISKTVLYKMIALSLLLVAIVCVHKYTTIPDKPVIFPLLVLFWLGVAYLILPGFFKKYQSSILLVYGAILSYFIFFKANREHLEQQEDHILTFLLVPIPVLLVLWAYEQWRWLKTLQADKGKAELALLKSQINPHFFFNTLNNLYGLVVEQSDKAPEVVLKLSDIMRYTIYEGQEDFVSLRQEVEYLENYIELHKIRYQKKVHIEFSHHIEIDSPVAPLLFIILLENALKHGVERMTKQAYIYLSLTANAQQVSFQIENNFDESPVQTRKGIGLENLKKRLKQMYPHRHELYLEKQDSVYKAQLNINIK